jgi:large subunit ribosomal protein L25
VADFSLEVQPRSVTGKKVSQLRNAGLVPATIYGPKSENVNIQIPYRALELALMHAGGTNLIDIMVDGKTHTVIAREVQRNVLRRTIQHVDFYEVDLKSKIRASIPVQYIGESPAVAARMGVLLTGPNTLTVEVFPADLPHIIEIDINGLKAVGDSVTVSDLDLGEKVNIINDPDEMLAKVVVTSGALAALEAEDAAEAAAASAEPELIRDRDEDDDE